MPKPGFIPAKLKPWVEARKRYHLSHAHVQMARELGINPKKLGSMANHKQESWKMPLLQFLEYAYEKRFSRKLPQDVRSIEKREAERRKRKETARAAKNDTHACDT